MIDKYKYYIDVSGVWSSVRLVKPIVISGAREGKIYDHRRKSSSWKIVRHENPVIYDALLLKLQTPSLSTSKVLVKIELWEDWGSVSSVEYSGYVPLKAFQVNEDNGSIEFTPIEQGNYSWYDEHKSTKFDIYNNVVGFEQSLTYSVTTVLEEYYIGTGVGHAAPLGFNVDLIANLPGWSALTDYTAGYTSANWVRHTGQNGSRAYRCVVENGPSSTVIEPGVTFGWEDYWEQHNTVQHVYRQVADLPLYVNGHGYIHGNDEYEVGFPGDININGVTETNLGKTRWSFATGSVTPETGIMTLAGTLNPSDPVYSTVYSNGASHKLYSTTGPNGNGNNTVLDHMLFGSGLVVTSHFFEDATNPVTGEVNHYTNLRLVHNQVIKRTFNQNTKGEITLDQFLTDLCETFNLGWKITGTSLRIEHVNYWENGESYSGSPSEYADLTDLTDYPLKHQTIYDLNEETQETDNEYSFAESETAEKEVFHYFAGYDYDGEIKYSSEFAVKDEVLKHEIVSFMADFANLIYFSTEETGDMYSLIACNSSGLMWRRNTYLRWIPGTVYFSKRYFRSETLYPNGDLMWDNLLNDLWVYLRPFTAGSINGEYPDTTIVSGKKIKKQRPIRFPRLSGVFDPNKTIKTNQGSGKVSSFEISCDTDWITVTLLYAI